MSKITVKLNYKGMGEMLKSIQVQAMLRERMQPVATSVGSTVEVSVGRTRARAKVAKGSDYDEANTGALSRALDLSGGSRGTHIKNPRKVRPQR
jgi:hypothetical protein